MSVERSRKLNRRKLLQLSALTVLSALTKGDQPSVQPLPQKIKELNTPQHSVATDVSRNTYVDDTIPQSTPKASIEKIATNPTPEAACQVKIDDLYKPLFSKIEALRKARQQNNPGLSVHIDQVFSRFMGILVFTHGQTHEPPNIEKLTIGSHSLFLIDPEKGIMHTISWTHDIRAPEIERYLINHGRTEVTAKKIDQAVFIGGFELQRLIVESMTGLPVDFQATCSDQIIPDIVDKVTGPVLVNVPKKFTAYPIYFQDKKYPLKEFPKGFQMMDGITALQYIKSVPINDPDPLIEHNQRKYHVIDALKHKIDSPLVYIRLMRFAHEATNNGTVQLDSEVSILDSLPLLSSLYLHGCSYTRLLPQSGHQLYFVDPAHGDGGVQWIQANSAWNPITKKDINNGIYGKELGFEVPYHPDLKYPVNPYSVDLVNDYWKPTRLTVKQKLHQL